MRLNTIFGYKLVVLGIRANSSDAYKRKSKNYNIGCSKNRVQATK